MTCKKSDFENIAGKREIAGIQQFVLFPQCFLPYPSLISIFDSYIICHLQVLSVMASLEF